MSTAKFPILIACAYSLFFCQPTLSWNAVGHRVIAQIAYDQLTPRTLRILNQYNRAVNQVYPSHGLIDAAVWLDAIRHQNINTYAAMHYINMPFTEDGSPLPTISTVNAITAIEQSIKTLQEPHHSMYQKGIALRILLHVVGDIHQPLHATSRVSESYPEGDRGGNLVELTQNSVAKNLHSYWDNGGGYLKCKSQYGHHHRQKNRKNSFSAFGLTATWTTTTPTKAKKKCDFKKMARELERDYPCRSSPNLINPSLWATESHELGVRAYQWLYHNNPDDAYQEETIKVVKKRIALAGCRLGFLLNQVVV